MGLRTIIEHPASGAAFEIMTPNGHPPLDDDQLGEVVTDHHAVGGTDGADDYQGDSDSQPGVMGSQAGVPSQRGVMVASSSTPSTGWGNGLGLTSPYRSDGSDSLSSLLSPKGAGTARASAKTATPSGPSMWNGKAVPAGATFSKKDRSESASIRSTMEHYEIDDRPNNYLTEYDDGYGIKTIGYGHTGDDVYKGETISQDQADQYYHQDIKDARDAVIHNVHAPLTQNQFDALVSLSFNCRSALNPDSDLVLALNAGDFAGAAKAFTDYSYVKHKFSQGLYNRRLVERRIFLTEDAPAKKSGSTAVSKPKGAGGLNGLLSPRQPVLPTFTPIPLDPNYVPRGGGSGGDSY